MKPSFGGRALLMLVAASTLCSALSGCAHSQKPVIDQARSFYGDPSKMPPAYRQKMLEFQQQHANGRQVR